MEILLLLLREKLKKLLIKKIIQIILIKKIKKILIKIMKTKNKITINKIIMTNKHKMIKNNKIKIYQI